MKKWLLYISVCVVSMVWTACSDENIAAGAGNGQKVELQLFLSLPGEDSGGSSRVGGTYQDGGLDHKTDLQRYIADDDVYVLVFGKDDHKLIDIPDLEVSGEQGSPYRILTGKLQRSEEEITLCVLVNLAQNTCLGKDSPSDVKSALKDKIGQTETEIYNVLTFDYPENDVWKLTETGRFLPMSGIVEGTFIPNADIYADCSLYRSVAKIGVTSKTEDFILKEVYVYYSNEQGKVVSGQKPEADVNVQYTQPDVPATNKQRDKTKPLKYEAESEGALNQIYVPESNNKAPGSGKKEMKIVVGGIYNGEGLVENNETAISYYRIDLEDNQSSPYDIIRNHSYLFNITAVSNPGTPDPDPDKAVAALTVEVETYTNVPMKGINSQYTLTVDNSVFSFPGLTAGALDLNITTDGTTWELVEPGKEDNGGWFVVKDETPENNGHQGSGGKVTIQPEAYLASITNTNETVEPRKGYFYIKAGKIKKRITVIQDPAETANCYLITREGEYLLKTDIRGNGNTKAWKGNSAEEGYVDIDFDLGAKIEGIDEVKIIWETSKGLVTIDDNQIIDPVSGCIPYQVHDVQDQWGESVFAPGHGGNALIGGFRSSDQKLLWSWHIWIVGDYKDGVLIEEWVTGRNFMDRYLGAYSNQPGTRSLGLLYQWGRKDPFIGANREHCERNYLEVPKAKTENYTVYGVEYGWKDWDTADETVENSIERPTTLLKKGFLSENNKTLDQDVVSALWGTKSSSIDVDDNGVKTMWDPCPPGYRVPSVHSWIFVYPANMTITSYNKNYRQNCRYVPYRGNDKWPNLDNHGTENFVSNAPFYGFWLDYTTNQSAKEIPVIEHGKPNAGFLDGTQTTPMTWLPLAGIYNGTIKTFGRCGFFEGGKLPASSLHMSSVIWLNAPSLYNSKRPAGVYLHGTEGAYAPKNAAGGWLTWTNTGTDKDGSWNGEIYSWADRLPSYKDGGRHIHRLNEEGVALLAYPNYAGSIRAVVDKFKIDVTQNVIDKRDITLQSGNNYTMQVEVSSVESWQVVNPGAKWIHVTPDRGKEGKTDITITCDHDQAFSQSTANIVIQFSRGGQQIIKVTRLP